MSVAELFQKKEPVPARDRSRELYNQELRKGVELGRKLGKLQRNVAKARDHVTECCAAMRTLGANPDSGPFKMLRNTVRHMKGKNEL